MDKRFLLFTVLLVEICSSSGCSLWKHQEKTGKYETIAANPTYDTAAAERAHAKAISVLDSYYAKKAVNLAEAENFLQKALVADVTYGPAHNTLGIVYLLQRKNYLAAWEFEHASKLMPDQIEPIYNLGQLYEAADKLDNAIAYYEQAMAISPRDATIVGSLASAQLKNGMPLDAVRPLLESIVFADHRPEWIEWARDQLGRHPIQVDYVETSTSPVDSSAPASTPKLVPKPPEPMSTSPLELAPKLERSIDNLPSPAPLETTPRVPPSGKASISGS